MLEGENQKSESDKLFEDMSGIEPPRDVDEVEKTGGNGDGDHEDLEARIEGSPKLSDMQTAVKQLNPDLGYKHLNVIQVSRTFPDVYNPLLRILVKSLIRTALCKNIKLSVAEAIAYVNTALSISIDGEGRIDIIHCLGRAVAEVEKDKNSMGVP